MLLQQRLEGDQLRRPEMYSGGLEPVVPVAKGQGTGRSVGQHRLGDGQHDGCPNMRSWLAPSIFADSIMLSGIVERKNVLQTMMLNDDTASGRISAQMVFFKPNTFAFTT